MKYLRVIICALLLAIIGAPMVVLASDISGALYYGVITVSNNSTANTSVSTTANISTQALIDGGYLNTSANNTAIRNSSGADMPFMPGYGGNPWVMWVPSIGTNSYLSYILYTAESADGEIRYFPSAGGMETADSAGLEISGNGSIEIMGWVNTDNGTDKNLIYKQDAVKLYVSGSQNITAEVYDTLGYIDPTGNVAGGWTNPTQAYNNNTADWASYSVPITSWSPFIELTHSAIYTTAVRYYSTAETPEISLIDIDVYYGNTWHDVFSSSIVNGAWTTINLPSGQVITAARVRQYNSDGVAARTARLNDFDFYGSSYSTVTATGITSGEHAIRFDNAPEEMRQNLSAGDDGEEIAYTTNWLAMTFTTTSEWVITRVDLYSARTGNIGIVTASIRAVDGSGQPTGADLTSGTADGDLWGVAPAYAWHSITLIPYVLPAGTYGLLLDVHNAPGGGNYARWRADATAPPYTGGSSQSSTDSGVTWAPVAGSDFLFRTYSGGNMTMIIDNVFYDSTANATMPDNSSNWTAVQNDVMPYMQYQRVWVDGTLQQNIAWEYDSTFTDLSGNSHDATPTFRTASSDTDISAALTSFQPISEAQAPAYALGETSAFISSTPNITGTFTSTPQTGAFPLAGVITAVATATSTPGQLPLLIIACFVILAASLTASALMRRYGSGSLIVKILVITAFMGIFIALANFGVDFWMLVVFLIFGIAISMASRQLGWQ